MFMYLFGFAVLLCIIHLTVTYRRNVRLIRKIPGERDTFLFGNALNIIIKSPVELFTYTRELAKKYNGIFSWWAFSLLYVNIYNPEDIETITSTMKYSKKSSLYYIIKNWLQNGLLLSDGPKWQSRRKILVPAFHFDILRQFFTIIEKNGQCLVDTLSTTDGKHVDVVPLLSEYTLNTICETAMGTKLTDHNSVAGKTYKNSIYELGKLSVERFTKIYYVSDFIYNMSFLKRKMDKHLDTVHSFTRNVIKERKEYIRNNGIKINKDTGQINDELYFGTKKKRSIAMLDLLILAEQEGIIDNDGIQEEVDTFMFEGHDTTAAGLTFFFMVLANHKDVQDKLYAELQDIFNDTDREVTMEDLNSMRYMECCIKESLRLYPPVPLISRAVDVPVQLSNYTVPVGTDCHIHIFDLHRRPEHFKNPLVFDPDRFLPENSVDRHPYAYIPFSAGPRNCIGQRFAMMEMKSCTAAVLRKFELVAVTKPTELEFLADFVLRTTHPIYVKFVERKL